MKVKHHTPVGSLRIEADARGLTSRSGTVLVGELAGRLGLTSALSAALEQLHRRPPSHDPGRVLVDLATMLIDGGECVSDLGALADQPDLFGQGGRSRARLGRGRASRADRLGLRQPPGRGAFREGGRGAESKARLRLSPAGLLVGWTRRGAGDDLAPGNAGANTAQDHVTVLEQAIAQLPPDVRDRERSEPVEILARSDSAGATHAFAAALRAQKIGFSLVEFADSWGIEARPRGLSLLRPGDQGVAHGRSSIR